MSEPTTPCETGNRTTYGKVRVDGRNRGVHRHAYERAHGPIPTGYQIDHLCRNPACVNLDHLEAVTSRENTLRSPVAPAAINARKSKCVRGHEFTPENTYRRANGSRGCRTCRYLHSKLGNEKRRLRLLAAREARDV